MERISLNGAWQVDLGAGFVDARVPGCWETLSASKTIPGPVSWRREFVCPVLGRGRRLLACFDAVSYRCEVSVNGRPAGSHEGMWDPFRLDVTDLVNPGEPNEILLSIEKPGYAPRDRFPLREVLSGFVPDVLCTFGGIWGDVELIEAAGYLPDLVTVSTDLGRRLAAVGVRIASLAGEAAPHAELELHVSRDARELLATRRPIGPGVRTVTEQLPLDDLALWCPEQPALYDVEAVVRTAGGETALRRRVGFRQVTTAGDRILLNGEPIYLRGALHWGYYPERVIPRPGREEIRRELAGLRAMGFNAVKFCLWVPRSEYSDLCDETGILAWLELPLWLPRATAELEPRMLREDPRIVERAAEHPSIVAYSLGCELGTEVGPRILERLAREVRALSGGALVCDNSGSGECYGGLAEDFSDFYDYHFYADDHNLESLVESFTPRWRTARPWLFGEYADADTWRVVPSGAVAPWWSRKDERTNPISALKPDFRLHLQPERLAGPGMKGREGLAAASLEHALLHRKLTIESTRAFPEVGGYNVTAIRDVPIATSGLFDDAMVPKFAPDDLAPFNADLVLVPRWDLARVWVNGDRVREADRYNLAAGDAFAMRVVASSWLPTIADASWSWRIVDAAERILAEGSGVLDRPLHRGDTRELFRISARLPDSSQPSHCQPQRLVVKASLVHTGGRTDNSWPLFAWPRLPAAIPDAAVLLHDPLGIFEPLRERWGAGDFPGLGKRRPDAIVTASAFDGPVEEHVRRGGRAFVVQRGQGAFPHSRVAFWREGFTLFEDHPVSDAIPRGRFRELALWGMAADTALAWIAPGGHVREVRPVITRIDAREFIAQHYLVELAYGRGRLIVGTLRIEGGTGKQPGGLAASSAALFLVDRVLRHLAARGPG
jgi:hypothetical protein